MPVSHLPPPLLAVPLGVGVILQTKSLSASKPARSGMHISEWGAAVDSLWLSMCPARSPLTLPGRFLELSGDIQPGAPAHAVATPSRVCSA